MQKSCKYCGRMHPISYQCPHKPQRKSQDTEQSRIRSGGRWQGKREEIKERDHFLCRYCLAQGKITYKGIEVHHIIPLAEDTEHERAFDNEWLISLCAEHHKQADAGKINREYLHELAVHIPPYPAGLQRR